MRALFTLGDVLLPAKTFFHIEREWAAAEFLSGDITENAYQGDPTGESFRLKLLGKGA